MLLSAAGPAGALQCEPVSPAQRSDRNISDWLARGVRQDLEEASEISLALASFDRSLH